eukprot:9487168-Pyramimonas_sp.AAC.1
MDAREHGSFPSRTRLYWCGLRNVVGDSDDMTLYFTRMLSATKVPDDRRHYSAYITVDRGQLRLESERVGLPLRSELSPAIESDLRGPGWKVEHATCFKAAGIEWPPDLAAWPAVDTGGLLPREVEAAIYLHKVWPPPEGKGAEFLDINPGFSRLLKGCYDEDGKPIPEKTPWRPRPSGLLGSTKLMVRLRGLSGKRACCVRAVEAIEMFRLIGWADSDWR